MTIPKQMIEAGAQSDATFDGRGPLDQLSRADRDRYLARAEAAISAALQALWQPIESAPRDGSPVLLLPHLVSASWDFGAENWLVFNIPLNKDQTVYGGKDAPAMWFEFMADHYDVKPTHWMPADAIPQPKGEEG